VRTLATETNLSRFACGVLTLSERISRILDELSTLQKGIDEHLMIFPDDKMTTARRVPCDTPTFPPSRARS